MYHLYLFVMVTRVNPCAHSAAISHDVDEDDDDDDEDDDDDDEDEDDDDDEGSILALREVTSTNLSPIDSGCFHWTKKSWTNHEEYDHDVKQGLPNCEDNPCSWEIVVLKIEVLLTLINE